jgi:riboflavin kinase/FMN adenylyltransferase
MNVTQGLAGYARKPHPVLTIGNFDGQHLGHRALLQTVVSAANRVGGTPLVLTFDPHPIKVLAPHVELLFLTSPEEKLAYLREAGIGEVISLAFTPELAALAPGDFVRDILVRCLGVKQVFVGAHFAFGKGRSGRFADLAQAGRELGFVVHPVEPVRVEGDIVSSTRIRRLLQSGDVRQAGQCLGRAYALTGPVIRGAQRGQTLGWPTANLRLPAGRVIPADGVYATRTVAGGEIFESVSYIGMRPTFGAGERLLEVYLLEQQRDLYGQDLRVEFVDRLRGDETFRSADELAERIGFDVRRAREILRLGPAPLPT